MAFFKFLINTLWGYQFSFLMDGPCVTTIWFQLTLSTIQVEAGVVLHVAGVVLHVAG